jgi:hypothetical protein
MNNEAAVALLIFVLGLAFSAGIYVASARAARKQINGLGGRVNRVQEQANRRMDRLALALVHVCPEARREELLRLLLEDKTEVTSPK